MSVFLEKEDMATIKAFTEIRNELLGVTTSDGEKYITDSAIAINLSAIFPIPAVRVFSRLFKAFGNFKIIGSKVEILNINEGVESIEKAKKEWMDCVYSLDFVLSDSNNICLYVDGESGTPIFIDSAYHRLINNLGFTLNTTTDQKAPILMTYDGTPSLHSPCFAGILMPLNPDICMPEVKKSIQFAAEILKGKGLVYDKI